MSKKLVTLLFLVFIMSPAFGQEEVINPSITIDGNEVFLKGLAVPFYGPFENMEYFEDNAHKFFERIRHLGANSIQIVFPIFQDGICATSHYKTEFTPSDEALGLFIEKAHTNGYSVMLKPVIDDGPLNPQWRGHVLPGCDADNTEAVEAWFTSYGAIMTEYALLAETTRVEFFSIGVELLSMDRLFRDHWINYVINPVRENFTGLVTYSANWNDGTVENAVPLFASELDFITIDAFYDLDAPESATVEELLQAWQYWVEVDIQDYLNLGIPVVFGEIGTTARLGSHRQPWNIHYCPATMIDTELCPSELTDDPVHPLYTQVSQARYYEAACLFVEQLGIDGIYWWEVDFYASTRSHQLSPGHSPLDKLAEGEVISCFSDS